MAKKCHFVHEGVTVGFAHERASVVESSGEFRMCLVRNYEALQDIIFTIEAEDDSAISDVGKRSIAS